jgi:hypothetical protein
MSCYGCTENLANQLAHMNVGGCLYCAPEAHPIGCAVCVTQDYLSGSIGGARRASVGTMRCQGHLNQCAYCCSPECGDNLLCERCSYSGAGNAAVTEAFTEDPICLYDKDMSPSESLACGCSSSASDLEVEFLLSATSR